MNRKPTHPGEILKHDILPELNMTKTEFAKQSLISRQTLYRILDSKEPIRVATALKLAKLLGNSAGFWINLQSQYDIWETSQKLKKEIDSIKTIEYA